MYSDEEIARLLAAAAALRPPLRAASHYTLIGLLAVAGMRIGEALRLDRGDVDVHAGVLTIERVPVIVEVEVAVPHLRPSEW